MESRTTCVKLQTGGVESGGREIMLGDEMMAKWKLEASKPVLLEFGQAKQEVTVRSAPEPDIIRIGEPILSQWGLLEGERLSLAYVSGRNTLSVGPLIGVLINRVVGKEAERPFGSITGFCREMHDACRQYGGVVFFFTPNEIRRGGGTIRGWHYSGGWARRTFPVPNVVYNRLTSRKLEKLKHVQEFMRRVRTEHQTAVFNERYLNKSEVFQALGKEGHVKLHLPESYLLSGTERLKMMCGKYPTVFLKPIYGSLGRGIIRISRRPDRSFRMEISGRTGTSRKTYRTLAALCAALSPKIKSRRYQIQQGLSLITVEGRPVDFRALVQRNERGKWSVTSIVARIAGHRHFVSNLAKGGVLTTAKDAVVRSNSRREGAVSRLRRTALQIAEGIETHIPGHFAELGIDLALDTHNRVYLIEVNSKPSKKDSDTAALPEGKSVRPSVSKVVKYCRYLSRF